MSQILPLTPLLSEFPFIALITHGVNENFLIMKLMSAEVVQRQLLQQQAVNTFDRTSQKRSQLL